MRTQSLSHLALILLSALFSVRLSEAQLTVRAFDELQTEPGKCCICEYQLNASPEEVQHFYQRCNAWLDNPASQCERKFLRGIHNGPEGPPQYCSTIPDVDRCSTVDYRYEGHSAPTDAPGFLDRLTELCFSCNRVSAEINGCSTFANYRAALSYLNSIELPPGVRFTVNGTLCSMYSDLHCPTEPDERWGCTLFYGCEEIAFESCPEPGSICANDVFDSNRCATIPCREQSGEEGSRVCCDRTQRWARPEDCRSCLGACCGVNGECRERYDPPSPTDVGSRISEGSCEYTFGGRWFPGASCSENPCPTDPGACCLYGPRYDSSANLCEHGLTQNECRDTALSTGSRFIWLDGISCGSSSTIDENSPCPAAPPVAVLGSCCVVDSIGLTNCSDSISRLECEDLRENPKVRSTKWREGAKCSERTCEDEGACCMLEICPIRPAQKRCFGGLNRFECTATREILQLLSPFCSFMEHHTPQVECPEIQCFNGTCVHDNPGAYVSRGGRCLDCVRENIIGCQRNPERCWAGCQESPGDNLTCCWEL